jgi:hypothetical protein
MGTPMAVHPSGVTHANAVEASCSPSDGLGFLGIEMNVLNLGSIREA